MEKSTYRKVMLRIVAPLTVLIVLSSLDRVNVSFAALRMNADLGLDPAAYGFGVSIFFWGYLLFQLPSAGVLRQVGPRHWIAGSVIGWGVVATAMAAIQTPAHFYILRFLLGVFESGFAPGVVWYVSQWLPKAYRARAIAGTLLAIPTSVIIGGPLCGWLMSLHWGDVASWRVMFAVIGLATVIAGVLSWFWFSDRPAEARWLGTDERQSIEALLDVEATQGGGRKSEALLPALRDPMLWLSGGVWFVLITAAQSIVFWLPIAVKASGLNDPLLVGVLSALPWVGIGGGMILNARWSDRAGERFKHLGYPMLLAAVALGAAALSGNGALAMAALVLGGFGLGAAQSVFWTVPTHYVGPRNPGAIATINLCGNVSSAFGPLIIGWTVASTGNVSVPVYVLAALLLIGALLVVPLARLARAREAR